MKRKCLALAVLAALSATSFYSPISLAATPNYTVVEYDHDEFKASDVGDTYVNRLVARHVGAIDGPTDINGFHMTVSSGKVWRIYAAAVGTQDEVDVETGGGTPVVDAVKIHTVSGGRLLVTGVDLNLSYKDGDVDGVAVIGGGMVAHGFALDNHVTISDTAIHDVYGGISHHGSANRNEVIIKKGVRAGQLGNNVNNHYGVVWGGLVNDAATSHKELDHADDNRVIVNGSDDLYLGGIVGAEIRGQIEGTVDGNSATLNSGHVQFAYGGVINRGEALNNVVNINGGLVALKDETSSGNIIGGRVNNGPASYNQININGGTVIGTITGGSGTETNYNQITIKGNPNLKQATLIGGTVASGKGNTLNLHSKQIIAGLRGFQVLNFHLGASEKPNDVLLLVDDSNTNITTGTDISNSKVVVHFGADAHRFKPGDWIVLLKNNDEITFSSDPDRYADSIVFENPMIDYGIVGFTETNKTLAIGIGQARIRPQSQALLKSNLSRLAFVNQASDMVADQGMDALVEASELGRHWFVALQGGSNHYNMDDYIDLDGQSLLFGGSVSGSALGGQLSLGAFFETGQADYEMLDRFPNQASMKGEGETKYRGGGLLLHWNQDAMNENGWFAEASLRAGHADLDYQTIDWYPGFEYDVSGSYLAAHLGLGYRHQIDNANRFDVFTKWFYSRHDSEDFTIHRQNIHFDSLESMRWRVGMNYAHRATTVEGYYFDWQTTLAYEHEFDATARGMIDEFTIHESELEGGTGIVQARVTFAPSPQSKARLHAAIQAFAGTREGVMGQLRWDYRF